jgi:hypothetical protein
MSQTATAPGSSPRAAFEEPLLARYSPHHELPLSTATSLGLHALVLGLLLIGGLVAARLNWGGHVGPPQASAVTMDQGGGDGPQEGGAGAAEDVPAPPAAGRAEPAAAPRVPLQEPAAAPRILPEPRNEADGNKEVDDVQRIRERVRRRMDGAAGRRRAPGGDGGPGGPGTGAAPPRQLRWTLIFSTQNGQDYARQLDAFGAILAFPDPKNADDYLVVRDLRRRPAEPKPEDISKIERIYWIDEQTASVQSLAKALGLRPPTHFVVFFPAEFEEKLLRLELGYRGKKESEIKETRFGVRRAFVTYEPYVVDQR